MNLETPFGTVDFKRVTGKNRPEYWTQIEINENWYLVHLGPPTEKLHPVRDFVYVHVWANQDGSKESISSPIELKASSYKRIATRRIRKTDFDDINIPFTQVVGKTLNTAICEIEQKQNKEEQLFEEMVATLEATKETHEGSIEYQLE